MHFHTATLGNALAAEGVEDDGTTEISDELLMLVYGGSFVPPAEASFVGPWRRILVEFATAVGADIAAQEIIRAVRNTPPQEPPLQANPSTGAQGRGSI